MQKNTLSYCGQLVRDVEPDHFLISMFMHSEVREALWAVFAFNYEISKTREVVSESTLGLIRLQWWRDAIKGIYNGDTVPAHEVLKPLSEVIHKYDLPIGDFEKLIYAREFDLEDVLPGDMDGLINYADFTTSPLLALVLRICDESEDEGVIRAVAVNYTLIGILRRTSLYARQCRCYFPADVMESHKLTADDIFNYTKPDDIKSVVRHIHDNALDRMKVRSRVLKSVQALSDIYMKQIHSVDFDISVPLLEREPAFKVLRIFWKIKIL